MSDNMTFTPNTPPLISPNTAKYLQTSSASLFQYRQVLLVAQPKSKSARLSLSERPKVISIFNIFSMKTTLLIVRFLWFLLLFVIVDNVPWHAIVPSICVRLYNVFRGDWKWENIAIYLGDGASVLVCASCHPQIPFHRPKTNTDASGKIRNSGRKKQMWKFVTDNNVGWICMCVCVNWCVC